VQDVADVADCSHPVGPGDAAITAVTTSPIIAVAEAEG